MKNLTAIELLVKIIQDFPEDFSKEFVLKQCEEVKHEEKKQIIDAVKFGNKDAHCVNPIVCFEQYYNETFKK